MSASAQYRSMRYGWCWWLGLVIGTGISSDTRLPGTGTVVDTPFVLFVVCIVLDIAYPGESVDPTSECRFLISVIDRKLADSPSLDASDIDKGDAWSKDPTLSGRKKREEPLDTGK